MIRTSALRRMLLLETAASDWFSRLGPEAQDAYRRVHPGTRYGGSTSGAIPKDDHVGKIAHHDHMVRYHSRLANQGGEDLDHPKNGSHAHAVALHQMASTRHFWAMRHAHDPRGARVAHSMSREADLRSRRVIHPVPGKELL